MTNWDRNQLVEDVYLHKNIYKYLGYLIHIPIATIEMAILDAMKSMCELIGDNHNTEIPYTGPITTKGHQDCAKVVTDRKLIN